MLFNTIDFACFFAIVFLLALRLGHRPQNLLLLAASYVFYGAWDWRFLGLIWLSTAIDWTAGNRIHAASTARARRGWMLFSVVSNLGRSYPGHVKARPAAPARPAARNARSPSRGPGANRRN